MANLTEQPAQRPDAQPVARARRRSPGLPGVLILLLTVALIGLEGVAIGLASSGEPVLATTLAWALVVLLIVAVIAGFVAIIMNRGRVFAIAAVLIGVLGNPLLATWLLTALGPHNS